MVSSSRIRMGAVLAACVATLTLAACGGDDDEDTTTTTTPTEAGATGETGETGAVPEDFAAQLETMLVEQGGYTQEQAECVAPKVADEFEGPEELQGQAGAQKLIDASLAAVVECGGPAPEG
jgi:hypothetical protein